MNDYGPMGFVGAMHDMLWHLSDAKTWRVCIMLFEAVSALLLTWVQIHGWRRMFRRDVIVLPGATMNPQPGVPIQCGPHWFIPQTNKIGMIDSMVICPPPSASEPAGPIDPLLLVQSKGKTNIRGSRKTA